MADSSANARSESDGLRHWLVATGLLIDDRGLLLVENERRNRSRDWTTPGGVVEAGEDPLDALSREVVEETGLTVTQWSPPLYRIEVVAPELGFYLRVDARLAACFSGDIAINDPDGIVTAAEFVDLDRANKVLAAGPRWVSEPLLSYLDSPFDDGRTFAYRVEGLRERSVIRVEASELVSIRIREQ